MTPAVVAWALDQDARSREGIGEAVGVDLELIDAWTTGSESPTVGQVSALAKTLARPRAFFFLPVPPLDRGLPDGYRRAPGDSRPVPEKVLHEARRARRVQLAFAATVPASEAPTLPRLAETMTPPAGAERVRDWLELTATPQWRDERAALQSWRNLLESRGVLTFALQLGADQVRGFASWDDRAPAVVFNTSDVTPSARLFTLGHELAHLALRQDTACAEPLSGTLTPNNQTERWCEAFAASLLMPPTEVRQMMADREVAAGEADIDDVKALMSRFRTSARASALRLVDLGFASEGLYPAVLRIFRAGAKKQTGKPRSAKRHTARRRQYGDHTVSALLQQLPPSDAMSVLRITVEDVRALADEVPGVPAL